MPRVSRDKRNFANYRSSAAAIDSIVNTRKVTLFELWNFWLTTNAATGKFWSSYVKSKATTNWRNSAFCDRCCIYDLRFGAIHSQRSQRYRRAKPTAICYTNTGRIYDMGTRSLGPE
jgi:hypothetical protein